MSSVGTNHASVEVIDFLGCVEVLLVGPILLEGGGRSGLGRGTAGGGGPSPRSTVDSQEDEQPSHDQGHYHAYDRRHLLGEDLFPFLMRS